MRRNRHAQILKSRELNKAMPNIAVSSCKSSQLNFVASSRLRSKFQSNYTWSKQAVNSQSSKASLRSESSLKAVQRLALAYFAFNLLSLMLSSCLYSVLALESPCQECVGNTGVDLGAWFNAAFKICFAFSAIDICNSVFVCPTLSFRVLWDKHQKGIFRSKFHVYWLAS
jgi:hypothetical protein